MASNTSRIIVLETQMAAIKQQMDSRHRDLKAAIVALGDSTKASIDALTASLEQRWEDSTVRSPWHATPNQFPNPQQFSPPPRRSLILDPYEWVPSSTVSGQPASIADHQVISPTFNWISHLSTPTPKSLIPSAITSPGVQAPIFNSQEQPPIALPSSISLSSASLYTISSPGGSSSIVVGGGGGGGAGGGTGNRGVIVVGELHRHGGGLGDSDVTASPSAASGSSSIVTPPVKKPELPTPYLGFLWEVPEFILTRFEPKKESKSVMEIRRMKEEFKMQQKEELARMGEEREMMETAIGVQHKEEEDTEGKPLTLVKDTFIFGVPCPTEFVFGIFGCTIESGNANWGSEFRIFPTFYGILRHFHGSRNHDDFKGPYKDCDFRSIVCLSRPWDFIVHSREASNSGVVSCMCYSWVSKRRGSFRSWAGPYTAWLSEALVFKQLTGLIKSVAPDSGQGTILPWLTTMLLQAKPPQCPIWSSGIMLSISTSQTSFPVIQASSMNNHLISGFTIPTASYSMFLVVTIIIWVVLYDRALLPLVSKLCGRPVKLITKLRMGLGLVASCLCMMVAASIVGVRRKKAIEGGYLNNPLGVVVLFCCYEGCCSYLSLLATWREFLFLYISMFGRQRSLLGFVTPLVGICSIGIFCHFLLLIATAFWVLWTLWIPSAATWEDCPSSSCSFPPFQSEEQLEDKLFLKRRGL